MFRWPPQKWTMAQYISQPCPKPGRNVFFSLLCTVWCFYLKWNTNFVFSSLVNRNIITTRSRNLSGEQLADTWIPSHLNPSQPGKVDHSRGALAEHGPVEQELWERSLIVIAVSVIFKERVLWAGSKDQTQKCTKLSVEVEFWILGNCDSDS